MFVVKSPGKGCVGRAKLWKCYDSWAIDIIPGNRVILADDFINYASMEYFSIDDEWALGKYNTKGKELNVNQCWRNHWIKSDIYGGEPDGFLKGPARVKQDGTIGFRKWTKYSQFIANNLS